MAGVESPRAVCRDETLLTISREPLNDHAYGGLLPTFFLMATICTPLHSSALSCLKCPRSWRDLLSRAAVAASVSDVVHDEHNSECSSFFDGLCNNGSKTPPPSDQKEEQHHVDQCDVLVLQCHSDGVMWRGLMPMLTSQTLQSISLHPCVRQLHHNDRVSSDVLAILTYHYQYKIRKVSIQSLSDLIANQRCNNSHAITNNNYEIKRTRWAFVSVPVSSLDFNNSNHATEHKTTMQQPPSSNAHKPLILIILPPNPYFSPTTFTYSRIPSSSPTSLFSKRLITYENTMIRLTSISAYISTLGGGFFMCRYLSTAVALARQQCRIALIRGDEEMAFRCRINEGYCFIHAGELKKGKRVIRSVLGDVIQRLKLKHGEEDNEIAEPTIFEFTSRDEYLGKETDTDNSRKEFCEMTVIKNMCHSALWFADQIKEAVADDKESGHGDKQSVNVAKKRNRQPSATHDDFQRIRIVKDRAWR